MKLAPAVFPLLYGKRLYRMGVPVSAAPSSLPASVVSEEAPPLAPPVDPWLRGAQSQVALVYGPEAATAEGAALLAKIVASMGVDIALQDRLQVDAPPPSDTLALVRGPVVFFGRALAAHFGPQRHYVLPSLPQLLADTAQKRAAWETIKTFKDTL